MEGELPLHGKKGLIVGIANEHSIAYGCAEAFRHAGAEFAVTYLNVKAEPYVRPLVEHLGSPIIIPCDVREPGQLDAVFARIRDEWGRLDFLLHSIAFAPREDLLGRVVDCSQAGFSLAMDVSCHSFIRMARLAEPLMNEGGCLLTMTFYGSEKVVEDYNLMGLVKAALEATAGESLELGRDANHPAILVPEMVSTKYAADHPAFFRFTVKLSFPDGLCFFLSCLSLAT